MKTTKPTLQAKSTRRRSPPTRSRHQEDVELNPTLLLQELQIHQSELESQNAELRQAQDQLERSRDRYAELIDFAPVGYLALDDRGCIREVNLAAAAMLGVERTRLAGVPFHLHIVPNNLARFREHLRQLESPNERVLTELILVRRGGSPLPVVMQSVRAYDAETKCFMTRTAITDITAQKQAEKALRESAELNRGILGSLNAHIAVLDHSGVIITINDAWTRFAQLNGDSTLAGTGVGSNYLEVCEAAAGSDRTEAQQALAGIRAVLNGTLPDFTLEYPCHSPREQRWFQMSVTPLSGGGLGAVIAHQDISERRKAVESLREERDLTSAVLQTAGALVIVLNETGQIVRFNRACEEITGYTATEVAGKVFWDFLLPPEAAAGVRAMFQRLRAGQHPLYFENYWISKTGQRRLIAWSNTVLCNPDGVVRYVIGTGVDITERKRDELRKQLHYETARLLASSKSLAELVPQLLKTVATTFDWDVGEFWEVDSGAKKLRVVHVWHKTNGKLKFFVQRRLRHALPLCDGLPGQVLASGKPNLIPDISQWPDFEHQKQAAEAALHSAAAFPILFQNQSLGIMAFLTHDTIQLDDDLLDVFASLGSQIGQFMERIQSEQALREAHEFGKQVIEGASAGIVVYDREGRFVDWNPFMEQISGYRKDEVIGRKTMEVFPFLREQEFEESFKRALGGEVFEGADTPFEVPEKGKHGWKLERFAPLRNAKKEIIGVIVAVRDITERRRLEAELLEISDAEQRRIGHDLHDGLGQQLTGLEMQTFILQDDLANADLEHKRRQLQERVRQISQSLRDCVTVTRSLARGLAPVNLKAEGLMNALEQLAHQTNVPGKLQCRFVCPTPVMLDNALTAGHLYRIAQEAVNNALKHAQARRIQIKLTRLKGTLCLQIKDNGRGLPQTQKTKTGMGLEVMSHRAHVIGASLKITTQPGLGVSVNCTLPLEKP